jgi:hypothetical protein
MPQLGLSITHHSSPVCPCSNTKVGHYSKSLEELAVVRRLQQAHVACMPYANRHTLADTHRGDTGWAFTLAPIHVVGGAHQQVAGAACGVPALALIRF